MKGDIMTKTLQDKMKSVGNRRRKKIEARTQQLVAEEMALSELRKAHHCTQASLAKELGITQDGVSRLEQRSDLLLSTLRKFIGALGGDLRLVAEFPGQPPVILTSIADLKDNHPTS